MSIRSRLNLIPLVIIVLFGTAFTPSEARARLVDTNAYWHLHPDHMTSFYNYDPRGNYAGKTVMGISPLANFNGFNCWPFWFWKDNLNAYWAPGKEFNLFWYVQDWQEAPDNNWYLRAIGDQRTATSLDWQGILDCITDNRIPCSTSKIGYRYRPDELPAYFISYKLLPYTAQWTLLVDFDQGYHKWAGYGDYWDMPRTSTGHWKVRYRFGGYQTIWNCDGTESWSGNVLYVWFQETGDRGVLDELWFLMEDLGLFHIYQRRNKQTTVFNHILAHHN